MRYYLLDTAEKHRRPGRGRYWMPRYSGYTSDVRWAGVYPETDTAVREALWLAKDPNTARTIAVPIEAVLADLDGQIAELSAARASLAECVLLMHMDAAEHVASREIAALLDQARPPRPTRPVAWPTPAEVDANPGRWWWIGGAPERLTVDRMCDPWRVKWRARFVDDLPVSMFAGLVAGPGAFQSAVGGA